MAFAGLVDDDDPDKGGSHHAAYHSDDDDACRCRLVIQTRASTTPDLQHHNIPVVDKASQSLEHIRSLFYTAMLWGYLEQNVCIKFTAASSSNKTRLS